MKLSEMAKLEYLNINIQFYHHDYQSEPFMLIEGKVKSLLLDDVIGYGETIDITTAELLISFNEKSYYTNISSDAVVFSSKNDDETYCIIEFI